MAKCNYCKEFNREKKDIEITDIRIGGIFYNYNCPLKYCPSCGKLLSKYKE